MWGSRTKCISNKCQRKPQVTDTPITSSDNVRESAGGQAGLRGVSFSIVSDDDWDDNWHSAGEQGERRGVSFENTSFSTPTTPIVTSVHSGEQAELKRDRGVIYGALESLSGA